MEIERKFVMFPSHIGSRSTHMLLYLAYALHSFHPTLVLAQQETEVEETEVEETFPSHIGSRSTKTVHGNVTGVPFPSHIGSRSTYPDRAVS